MSATPVSTPPSRGSRRRACAAPRSGRRPNSGRGNRQPQGRPGLGRPRRGGRPGRELAWPWAGSGSGAAACATRTLRPAGPGRLGAAGNSRSPEFAAALRLRAGLALDAGEAGPARDDAARLEELSRTENRPLDAGRARNLMGIADRAEGRYAKAAAHFRAALDCFEGRNDAAGAAGARNNLAVTLMEDPQGDKAEAEKRLGEALALHKSLGDRRGMAEALTNLGNLRQAAGDWAGAERFFAQALAHEQALRDTSGVARSLSNLGEVAEARGGRRRPTACMRPASTCSAGPGRHCSLTRGACGSASRRSTRSRAGTRRPPSRRPPRSPRTPSSPGPWARRRGGPPDDPTEPNGRGSGDDTDIASAPRKT